MACSSFPGSCATLPRGAGPRLLTHGVLSRLDEKRLRFPRTQLCRTPRTSPASVQRTRLLLSVPSSALILNPPSRAAGHTGDFSFRTKGQRHPVNLPPTGAALGGPVTRPHFIHISNYCSDTSPLACRTGQSALGDRVRSQARAHSDQRHRARLRGSYPHPHPA